ncbi:MAG: heavy metal translocating P-type ATPase [Acidobacteria bacterium]|nr:heavy metal translocating P-type ATPase [Acidobacteriota bacterium]MCB9397469.1 heavy metal translocating P-type ATPase [Acidobacteriota bacterium]
MQPVSQLTSCEHCRNPLQAGQDRFCCAGCQHVFHLIHANGLQHYYLLRGAETLQPIGERADSAQEFAYLNSETFRQEHARTCSGGFETQFSIEGIQCAACVWLIESVSRAQPHLIDAEVRLEEGSLVVTYETPFDLAAYSRQLAQMGYQIRLFGADTRLDQKSELLRLGIAGALAGNIMLLTMPFYTGLQEGFEAKLFAWMTAFLSIPLMLYGARPFWLRAWAGLRSGALNLDVPISLGMLTAFLYSVYFLLKGHVAHLYFDSLGMLIFFLLLGRFIQQRGVNQALRAARKLSTELPELVQVERDGRWMSCPASQLMSGERIQVHGGGLVPVDAYLASESASLNLQVVSGESRPIHIKAGQKILAGSINLGQSLDAFVIEPSTHSYFEKLKDWAQQLTQRKRNQIGDRHARWFLPLVLSLSALGFARGVAVADWEHGFTIGLSILIVACPCALALAGPTSQAWALHHAAQLGLWIKSLHVFEAWRGVREVMFDKTGVLTAGQPQIIFSKYFTAQRHWLDAAIHQLEKSSNHPIAAAFLQQLNPVLELPMADSVHIIPGMGLEAKISGRQVVLTSRHGIRLREDAAELEAQVSVLPVGEPTSEVIVFVDGKLAAYFQLSDTLRPGCSSMVQKMTERGLTPEVCSGDAQGVVEATAHRLGISAARGNLMPEQKDALLNQRGADQVMMVGDGLNDLAALARSAVGVVPHSGSEAAIRIADVVYQADRPEQIALIFEMGEAVDLATRRGIQVSLAYNAMAISLCFAGQITPLLAAIFMPLSSLSVLFFSAWFFQRRRKRWES